MKIRIPFLQNYATKAPRLLFFIHQTANISALVLINFPTNSGDFIIIILQPTVKMLNIPYIFQGIVTTICHWAFPLLSCLITPLLVIPTLKLFMVRAGKTVYYLEFLYNKLFSPVRLGEITREGKERKQ